MGPTTDPFAKKYQVRWVGKIEMFWFLNPVEGRKGQYRERDNGRHLTRAVSYRIRSLKDPLYAFACSSLHLRPAKLLCM